MKIILSPSKTASYCRDERLQDAPLFDATKTANLVTTLSRMSKVRLGKALSVKGDILDQTYQAYKNFTNSDTHHAFSSYTGLVFKQLNREDYDEEMMNYIQNHVRILDALYGVLEPGTLIAPYRLDMKAKLNQDLYAYWNLDPVFAGETVINLASNEFARMLTVPMITVQFLQQKNGKLVNQATYAKMGRGMVLDYMIQNQITSIDDIKRWSQDGYRFDPDASNETTITFTR